MLAVERRNRILERLQAEGRVVVAPLAGEFCVSEETIRRDLAKLERDGYAARGYGGAVFNADGSAEPPYSMRKKTNIAGKQRIAHQVADLVFDGDFIMLDESSTASFVARAITGKRNITLITNSIDIIAKLRDAQGWNVLCTGGTLKTDVLALTGHQAESFIRSYHVNTAIVSCTGLDLAAGFTEAGEDNALIKQAMMASADKTILAADFHKFNKRAFAPIGRLDSLYALATDVEPSDDWKTALAEYGVKLLF
ncbi:MAG: DeoR/GlpR family DNA-binding transcription regulator [Clostridiales bacterium]|nr:DeoR/GlpR family DNA-binding transcription regulator [Clostridiales bacterium]